MTSLFVILFLLSLLGLIIGLIRPVFFRRIFKQKISRKTASMAFTGLSLLFLILASITAPKTKSTTTENKLYVTKPLDAWETSANWGGYIKKGKNITSVSGQWTVPHVLYSNDIRGSGTWIGIGGWNSLKLLQIGVVNFENQGINVPSAFTQRYPLEPRNIEVPNFPVRAADKISASINKLNGDHWRMTIADLTTGRRFTKTVSYQPDQTTADWIFEWVTPEKYHMPVFEKFSFSNLFFSGQADPLASTDRLKLVESKKVLVEPSKLNAANQSFSLTYTGR